MTIPPPINYKEIFEAWLIAFNPTPAQQKLANLRLEICTGCEFRKETVRGLKWSAYCGECGCPMSKKVFSPYYNACPLGKWGEIDSDYIEPPENKKNNTLI